MKRASADCLARADQSLAKARVVLGVHLPDEAGRLAHYAMLHAAQALIFERTNRVAKTHRGVSQQFHQIARNEVGLDPVLPSGLSNAYRLKQSVDDVISDVAPVTPEQAIAALSAAEDFVSQVRQVLNPSLRP